LFCPNYVIDFRYKKSYKIKESMLLVLLAKRESGVVMSSWRIHRYFASKIGIRHKISEEIDRVIDFEKDFKGYKIFRDRRGCFIILQKIVLIFINVKNIFIHFTHNL